MDFTSSVKSNLSESFKRIMDVTTSTHLKQLAQKYSYLEEWSIKETKAALLELQSLLLNPEDTVIVAHSFPELVPILLSMPSNAPHARKCVTIAKLLDIHPDVFAYALKYFEKSPAPWEDHLRLNQTEGVPKKKRKETKVTDVEIAETCLRFLRTSASHFKTLWKWSEFARVFLQHKDDRVKRLACHCMAIVTGMDESQLRQMTSRFCQFPEQGHECDPLLPPAPPPECVVVKKKCLDIPFIEKICPSVVSVAGITLPVYDSAKTTEGSLVLVESTLNNLRRAALGVASGRAVCLMGPVGCGKTATVEHLAQITGRPEPPGLLKVQLGDETDAKMLLGAYCCTDVPGEFIWQPGVLTKAVSGGHWLLLEDIDSATSDVIAVLASLLETGAVNVPGYRDNLRAVPGFQLFFTYRLMSGASGTYKQRSNVCELLEKHWVQVNMEPLTREELQHIVQVKFPVLKTVAARMVNLYLKFSAGEHEGLGSNSTTGRLTSTRDLIKWCTRAVVGFDVSSPDSALKVLQDAIDIFCCNINNPESRILLAKSVSANLGIVQTKAEFFLSSYKPQPIKVINNSCVVGRASLPVKKKTTFERRCDVKFAQTRPSACLLERVSVCLSLAEPVLLVGETGTGKTSTLQLLAHRTGHELVVLNMNQQSDSADLLGGFKPVDVKFIIAPIRNEFEKLFRSYFKVDPNIKFLEHVSNCFTGKKWNQLLQLMKHSQSAAVKRLTADIGRSADEKKQLLSQWRSLGEKIYRLETQLKQNQAMLAFTFVEGTLVRALKEGWWVLLDEINLASAETLQCLAGLLEGGALVEGGDSPRRPHPAFRLLAAMNPATDVGKRDLPPGIRNRFTELYVDELTDRTDLALLVSCYLPELPPARADAVVRFYLDVRAAAQRSLGDAAGHKPHYSLRTLCRALVVAARNSCGNSQRTLHAALCLSFLTQLDAKSHQAVLSMINRAVAEGGDIKGVLGQPIPEPQPVGSHVCFEGYWVEKGRLKPEIPDNYILTPCVRRNLQDLSCIVSLSQYPVLVQGDTSVGKTSLVTFLASATGNKCVRINNHEHTDLQEYIGSYCADQSGQLVFREGVLVQAMRLGHWIILDELNLAPTDVLEALNRVLDDNRELYIPETQETVRAHPSFRLFATQNPPGLYGGRKMLSRAFRNRFVELHFNEIPGPELETILHQRCAMPTSYCKKLVAVMTELQLHRKGSAAFAGKQGFITLRDLFRWGERYRLANLQQGSGKFYDWDQHIADEGYLVLAGRVRRQEETEVIRQVIRKHIKRSVDPDKLFTLSENTSPVTRHILERVVGGELPPNFRHIVWTFNLRRLAVLVGKACEFKESVLLVGDTGCGKTTVCQLLAALNNQKLFAVNCHQHSESSDFLGALRPVRDRTKQESAGRLFEWVDGPLVEAMRGGGVFLADEISLADDSVLERLNSLLEPERTLLLSEKGAAEEQFVVAQVNFRFFGTMNPGGDFGKKELSPALRNRLTEVWCEGVTSREDWLRVVEHNVRPGVSLGNQQDGTSGLAPAIVDFMDWFRQTEAGKRVTVSVRDVLTWVSFINTVTAAPVALDTASAYIHGACLTLVDGLGTGNTSVVVDRAEMVPKLRTACLEFLIQQVEKTSIFQPEIKEMFISEKIPQAVVTETQFGIPPFFIPIGENRATPEGDFTFGARTTSLNTSRLLRALQLPGRAVLLEGSPGVGKTSLVAALARAAGHPLTRINLSDQTDVSDLFGADLPVEGAAGGTFAWRDGPFLRALRLGHWILLDELNLASQSVLEGLNAVLDHRGELFIPELGRSFTVESTKTRLFACQNPLRQGGARRGLPQSFLNRFTQVYMEPLTATDLTFITTSLFPQLPATLVEGMVRFTLRLAQECGTEWAQRGAPWEMNLRDVTRWAEAMARDTRPRPERYVQLVYADRMRTAADKRKVLEVYTEELGGVYPLSSEEPGLTVTPGEVVIGDIVLPRERGAEAEVNHVDTTSQHLVLRSQLGALRSLAACVDNNWLSIVVGPSGSGKTAAVQTLAQLCGRKLQMLSVNSAMDTTEILGGFEQVHI